RFTRPGSGIWIGKSRNCRRKSGSLRDRRRSSAAEGGRVALNRPNAVLTEAGFRADAVPHRASEWFTAAELAELALPGLPADKRSINRRAQDERWSIRTGADG